MKLAIITSGFLPVPAAKGGAVENLIENLIKENEKNKKIDFVVFSIQDKSAETSAMCYKNSKFKFIKTNFFVKIMDKVLFFIAKNVLKKENSQSYRFIFQRLAYLHRVSKDIRKNDYDKILLENHPTQYLALKWKKNYKKYAGKYFYHCHNEFPGTYGCTDIIKNTEKFICVSEFIAKQLREYLELDLKKFIVLRNGIDISKFEVTLSDNEKKCIRKQCGIAENDRVMIFTGRLVPEKGIKELLKSLENIKEKNWKLLIIGSALNSINIKTKYEEEIDSIVKKLEKNVIFTGFVRYEEIYKFYNIADFAILPSIWDDPAPLTIIESLVNGLPIITTNSGGITEYVNNDCAVVIERDENLVKNLSSAIQDLLENENLRRKMSVESKKCSENLNSEIYYKDFFDIVKK